MNGTISMTAIYGVVAILSLILAVLYWRNVRQKECWLLLVNAAVFVVNAGYFLLSVSKTVEGALAANRISYFGSVFLPLGMLMTIIKLCKIRYGRKFVSIMLTISIAVFLLAASGGYLDVYYKSASIQIINGATKLVKVYGPLHCVYLFYLLGYFGMMVGVIGFSVRKKDNVPHKLTTFLAAIVLGNVAIWFIEQLIKVDFEFLSISYVITECLLLLLYGMVEDGIFGEGYKSDLSAAGSAKAEIQKNDDCLEAAASCENIQAIQKISNDEMTEEFPEYTAVEHEEISSENNCVRNTDTAQEYTMDRLVEACPEIEQLTAREMEVLYLLIENVKRKDIADRLGVSENTVKKHTSHIFSKLEVASRKELFLKIK